MKTCSIATLLAAALVATPHASLAQTVPFDGERFVGRIAFSSDGNFNDEDDWGAFPVAIAMIDACGVTDHLVHVDYNNIMTTNDDRFQREMHASVMGAVERYAVPESIVFDCQTDAEAAVASITAAINASSAADPLYFVLAGPMDIPYRGIMRADPDKRKHVYCISHNSWNDGFFIKGQSMHVYNKRDVIDSGINWVQCAGGNRNLAHPGAVGKKSTPQQWKLYEWLRDSPDENLNWIYTRLEAEQRCDISDSTMMYFLLTGDERCDLQKLRRMIEAKKVPPITRVRKTIRLEAENFVKFDDCGTAIDEKKASQRVYVLFNQSTTGRAATPFREIYAGDGVYDVAIGLKRTRETSNEVRLYVNGYQQGPTLSVSATGKKWASRSVPSVVLSAGDELTVEVAGADTTGTKLDYVDLKFLGEAEPASRDEGATPDSLDDPNAAPGQIIVADSGPGSGPGYLKYNGGGPAFLSGPDNPEDFFFRGEEQPDGTRVGGGQEAMIERIAKSGANAFHCQMTRMRVCNFKDEGDDTHTPFIDHDPAKGLNPAVLDQWDTWIGMMEERGILLHFEFYNDATDVEMIGWKLDAYGNLHPDEKNWIEGIVNRFKHRKNILWGIEESVNKLPGNRTTHFRKIGELIAATDEFNHPIVQSFVVPDDPDGDFYEGGVMSDVYRGDPNIRVVTWLHIVPHKRDYEAQHREYLKYRELDGGRFVVMKNETFNHPRKGRPSRIYMWSCAMTGIHTLEAYHNAEKSDDATLRQGGIISEFMEKTDFYRMAPRDELAAGETKWVLADEGSSYIAYSYACNKKLGVQGVPAGAYDLLWVDTETGDMIKQPGIEHPGGDAAWTKPEGIGLEVAVYARRR